jgi:hypothetical protein
MLFPVITLEIKLVVLCQKVFEGMKPLVTISTCILPHSAVAVALGTKTKHTLGGIFVSVLAQF